MTRRPNRRRLAVIITAAAPLFIILVLYVSYRVGLRPVSDTGAAQQFTVSAGENAPRIGQHLLDAKLIRNRDAFVTYVNFHGLRPRLKVGTYLISPTLSAGEIAELLAGGRTLSKRVVVPEGSTLRKIQDIAVAAGIPAADFKAALAAPHSQSFLAGKPPDVDLEGYLFPDSYSISATTTATQLVDTMLDTFASRVAGTESAPGAHNCLHG
jgi:UPF0755 protein